MAKLKKTILVADDDKALRTLLREILSQEGYDVLEASDGQEALAILSSTPVDLLITDRSMPGMGGLELLAQIKAKKMTLPVLMVSAYGEEEFWGKAIGLGAVDYILKPFKASDVLKIVHKCLGAKK